MAAERRVEPWPIGLVLLLLSMMTISVGFYGVAARHPDALVVDDAYEAGLRYNAELRERRLADALGVDLALRAEPAPGGVHLRVELMGPEGGAVRAERVVVRRLRPAEGGYDADFELARSGDVFTGELPLPRPGRWHLRVTARVEGHDVERTFRLGAG